MFSFLEFLLHHIFLLSHISSGSFPKPLSEEEEQYYLKRYKEEGDDAAKNKLIEHNLRLVAHIVKKYSGIAHDADDLLSIGTIGLIKGITTFDYTKKTKLSTYAARCIHNEILMVLRSGKHSVNEVSLQEAIGYDKEGNEVTLMDVIPSGDDEISAGLENKMQIKRLYEGIKSALKPRERTILELRYGIADGKEVTQREIAKNLGISRSYVSRIEKKAVEKLKKQFDASGLSDGEEL